MTSAHTGNLNTNSAATGATIFQKSKLLADFQTKQSKLFPQITL